MEYCRCDAILLLRHIGNEIPQDGPARSHDPGHIYASVIKLQRWTEAFCAIRGFLKLSGFRQSKHVLLFYCTTCMHCNECNLARPAGIRACELYILPLFLLYFLKFILTVLLGAKLSQMYWTDLHQIFRITVAMIVDE